MSSTRKEFGIWGLGFGLHLPLYVLDELVVRLLEHRPPLRDAKLGFQSLGFMV